MLAAGHYDAMLVAQSIALYQLKQRGLSGLTLAGHIDSPYSYRFAVAKGNHELLEQINRGLTTLMQNGDFQQLHKKWLEGGLQAERQQRLWLGISAAILLLLLILGGALWRWKTIHTRKLLEQAHHDPLTGLPSRTLLMDRLEHALDHAGRVRAPVAVLYLDLDGFKPVNDTLGHAAGDVLLQAVAQRLLNCVRTEDTVARLGGDEFVIVLEHLERAGEADMVAGRVLHALQQPFAIAGQPAHISASLGVSLYPQDGTDAGNLLQYADAAMYRDKQEGRRARLNRVEKDRAANPAADQI
ncbi:diguanylate cyclase domain-containing protein [Oceanimonas marisflavi]|uniref:diguanylate cyclase domain-containing protein n=1 Tax=Oceanimonas marisflavi TaxID=2059724 RepID=UPI000D2FD337|nr:GGDEF domain-containing protein [Oceanimonas marisflavi]